MYAGGHGLSNLSHMMGPFVVYKSEGDFGPSNRGQRFTRLTADVAA